MHEMALAESMLEIVENTARNNGATRVTAVCLELGALSHVEPEALRFCFDAVTRGGLAERRGARDRDDAGRGVVHAVRRAVPLAQLGDACPRCGSYQLTVVQGEEMRVKEIEIA